MRLPAAESAASGQGKPWAPLPGEAGTSVVEILVVLLLLALVGETVWRIMSNEREAAASVGTQAEGLETVRTVAFLLREELRGGERGRDWQPGEDTVALRAFRGLGLVQTQDTTTEELAVCYRGIRNPAPEKDSVLVLAMDGSWTVHDLVERTRSTEGCSWDWDAESHLETWVLFPAPVRAVLARVFERGSYHLVGGALRYRRGEGGRQPLTPERITEGRLTGYESPSDALVWDLFLSSLAGQARSARWRGSLW